MNKTTITGLVLLIVTWILYYFVLLPFPFAFVISVYLLIEILKRDAQRKVIKAAGNPKLTRGIDKFY